MTDAAPIPLTEADVTDIQAAAQAKMDASKANGQHAEVMVTHINGGVIVQVTNSYVAAPAAHLRHALQQVGYVLVGEDFAYNAVVVTGRDPGHTWSKKA
uniref:hypothetical protein n=1 Tax=Nonomuraea sp. CA-251285 TaxID=3240002 RepID=UPI003F496321